MSVYPTEDTYSQYYESTSTESAPTPHAHAHAHAHTPFPSISALNHEVPSGTFGFDENGHSYKMCKLHITKITFILLLICFFVAACVCAFSVNRLVHKDVVINITDNNQSTTQQLFMDGTFGLVAGLSVAFGAVNVLALLVAIGGVLSQKRVLCVLCFVTLPLTCVVLFGVLIFTMIVSWSAGGDLMAGYCALWKGTVHGPFTYNPSEAAPWFMYLIMVAMVPLLLLHAFTLVAVIKFYRFVKDKRDWARWLAKRRMRQLSQVGINNLRCLNSDNTDF